eukprot:2566447-Pleurochrysis_carterae.AAC.1
MALQHLESAGQLCLGLCEIARTHTVSQMSISANVNRSSPLMSLFEYARRRACARACVRVP